jgi:long-chain acyl-CoA synthetase
MVLRPTIFPSVPRLWNRIYDRVMSTIRSGSPLARMLFERAFAYKKACLERGDPVGGHWGAFYDRLVFSKIRAKVGGQVKLMTTGWLEENLGEAGRSWDLQNPLLPSLPSSSFIHFPLFLYLLGLCVAAAGASPISDEVMMFLRVCFGAIVLEGYGMTESSCTIW